MDYKDYYQILGVSRDASQLEIKQAYRKLARKFHPDVSSESDAEERFKEVGEAYEVLKNPEKRSAYDQLGNQWKGGQTDFTPPPDWNAGFEFHRGSGADDGAYEHHFSDFFESLFGAQGQHGFGDTQTFKQAEFNLRGNDSHAKIFIDLEDAYQGATRNITLKSTLLDKDGAPRTQERSLNVKIPAGVRQGQNIRLQGQGSPGIGNAAAGDLYLEIEFNPHSIFKVLNRDVFLEVPVTPWEAALGSTITVPTPSGKVKLKIPKGTSSGKKMRFKGRGIPGSAAGDFYVSLQIVLSGELSEKEASLYEALKNESRQFEPRAHLEG